MRRMSVHCEPLLQLGDLSNGIDECAVPLPALIVRQAGQVGQVQAAGTRVRAHTLLWCTMARLTHLRNVMAHVHNRVREHGVGDHRKGQISSGVW